MQKNILIKNAAKVGAIVAVFLVLSYALRLPYLNIIALFFTHIPYFVAILLIIYFFKPRKTTILISAIILFPTGFILTLFNFTMIAEHLSVVSYFMIALYLVFSFGDMRKMV